MSGIMQGRVVLSYLISDSVLITSLHCYHHQPCRTLMPSSCSTFTLSWNPSVAAQTLLAKIQPTPNSTVCSQLLENTKAWPLHNQLIQNLHKFLRQFFNAAISKLCTFLFFLAFFCRNTHLQLILSYPTPFQGKMHKLNCYHRQIKLFSPTRSKRNAN